MGTLSDKYRRLFEEFRRIEREMAERQPDRQRDLITAARAIIRFEHEHELPRLKQWVSEHAAAVSAIEGAKQKLLRLERSIANQRDYIATRFPTTDTTADAIDCLAWELSAKLGASAIERMTVRAAELERELREFVKERKGISHCLTVEQERGWDKVTRENFSWLEREVEQAQAQRKAA
jgi:hypothetical protein